MYEEVNPDILEILLSHTFQLSCVLRGELAYDTLFLHIVNIEKSFFKMSRILYHSSFHALDPDLLQQIYPKLYPNTPPYQTAEIVANTPNKFTKPGVNIDYVKFSLWDHQVMEHYIRLYDKLVEQTNDLEPLELGKRVVFLPNNMPHDFKGIEDMLEFIIKKKPDPELVAEGLVRPLNDEDLTLEKLHKHRDKFEACIGVTSENRRLYTRSRFLINMFIDLNPYIKHAILKDWDISSNEWDTFIGEKIKRILLKHHTYTFDKDNYPVFTKLYTNGVVANETFPTEQDEVCLCGHCPKIPYLLYLYESNTGQVYVIVVLEATDSSDFLCYIFDNKCYFELYKFLKKNPDYWYNPLTPVSGSAIRPLITVEDVARRIYHVTYRDAVEFYKYPCPGVEKDHPDYYGEKCNQLRSQYHREDIEDAKNFKEKQRIKQLMQADPLLTYEEAAYPERVYRSLVPPEVSAYNVTRQLMEQVIPLIMQEPCIFQKFEELHLNQLIEFVPNSQVHKNIEKIIYNFWK